MWQRYTPTMKRFKTRTKVAINTKKVKSSDTLRFELKPRGGVALKITRI